MHKVFAMFKRTLAIFAGITLGAGVTLVATHAALSWGWFGNRELDRSTNYVREVLQLVNENYVDAKESGYGQLTKSALHGMVETLDPHSEFLESRDYQQVEEEMSGKFGGIGIQVEMRKNRVVVIAPIAGTPGERAGILRGDEIVRVNGSPIDKGVTMVEVIDHLRGPPHTKVTVGLYRPGTGETMDLTLVREIIKVDSVREVRVLPGGIGYIQLAEFSERSADEFNHALDRLLRDDINSLVLDLRNNPGGLLDAAVEVAEPFFSKGELIVYTQGTQAVRSRRVPRRRGWRPAQAPAGGADQRRERQRGGNRCGGA